jgi:hypothetical protein
MRKILLLSSIICIGALGCKKDQKTVTVPDSDKANRIFRVVTRADVKYKVNILEISPVSLSDTIQNVTSHSGSPFNFGFTPKIGSRVLVTSDAPNARSLDCTVIYRGNRLGLDQVEVLPNSLGVKFEYIVKD